MSSEKIAFWLEYWILIIPTILFWVLLANRASEYRRAYYWFWGLPGARWLRKKLVSDPPLFGERHEGLGHRGQVSFPTFVRFPKWDTCPVLILLPLYAVWLIIVVMPYIPYHLYKKFYLFMHAIFDRVDELRNPEYQSISLSATFFKHYDAGKRVTDAGRKGAAAKAELSTLSQRDDSIRAEAHKLILSGRDPRALASILVRRYAGLDGYPTSEKQYRAIIKSLRDETKPEV